MNGSKALERWLLAATVASGIMVVFAHGGGTTGCATSERRDTETPSYALLPGHSKILLLRHTLTEDTATIERGAVISVLYDARDGSKKSAVGPLVGVVDEFGTIIIDDDGDRREIPADVIDSIAIVGEHPRGRNMTRGALIGGLTGAALGAIAGAAVGGNNFGGVCAVGFGVPGGAAGAGVGLGMGAAASPGRGRFEEYKMGTGGWKIDRGLRARQTPVSSVPIAPSAAPPVQNEAGAP